MKTLRLASTCAVCLPFARAAGAPSTSRATRQDSKAESSARNMVSQVESCYTDTVDYRKCDSRAELNPNAMDLGISIGSGPGQVRVIHAKKNSYTVDAHSRSGNHFYLVRTADGRALRKCTARGDGLCKNNGTW